MTVNGQHVSVHLAKETSLMQVLRDYLGLTGTKNGCSSGHCGACTVILNGKAVRSCLVKIERAQNGQVLTIEGLAQGNHPHPLQYTFCKYGAIQCGFCTPGMILSAKALLDVNPNPSDEEIKHALTNNRNLCRCTGYTNILTAIHEAASMLRDGINPPAFSELMNEDPSTLLFQDAMERATGRTQFGADRSLENQLIGKVLWSAYPRARILGIDTSEVESLPGVAAVLTYKDIPGKNISGLIVQDHPVLAENEVNSIGDAVAVVFAENAEQASQALSHIHVNYEPLPGVFSPQEAAKENAPQISPSGNLMHQAVLKRGDAEEAFKLCAHIVENDYHTPHIEHAFLEPESGLAFPTPDGGITVQIGSQGIFEDRRQLCNILAMPEEKIRVILLPMGGAFGGKEDMVLQPLLALGALKTGRPVKMALTREESLRVHVKKHPAWMHYKTGVDSKGHLLALQASILTDAGYYASESAEVLENMVTFAAGPYSIPNVTIHAEAWRTNNISSGSMRGFGVNQVAMAAEQQMDEVAEHLNMDPFEFRLLNGVDETKPTITNDLLPDYLATYKQTITAVQKAFLDLQLPESTPTKKIGWGVASSYKNAGLGHGASEEASIIVTLDAQGQVTLKESHHDIGQGAKTPLVRLVRQELGTAPEHIHIISSDTSLTPRTGETSASRQTFLTGNALLKASKLLKEEIIHRAADFSGYDPTDLRLEGDAVKHLPSGEVIPLARLGEKFEVCATYSPPATKHVDFQSGMTLDLTNKLHWCYVFTTQVAVVEVDTETGEVKVLKVIAGIDVGHALNRPTVEGQIQGGILMGLGYALSEEYQIKDGYNLTDTLQKAHLPYANQVPEIQTLILETPHPDGPMGAKGFAEAPLLATTPAILNAIHNAVGIRPLIIPTRPQYILELLNSK